MRDLKTFRLVNKIETTMIYDSLIKLSPNLLHFFEKNDYRLYISLNELEAESKFPSIFLISKDQLKLLRTLKNDKIISAGLYFGFIKKGNFYISLEGAEFLYNNNLFSDLKRIHLNDKGEKSILYGNNILKKMVFKESSNLQKEDFLLVFNKLNEVIAIAKSIINYQNISNIEPNKIIAINLNDKGVYLRIKQ